MAGSDLMMIVLVGGILYYLHSTGQLEKIFGGLGNLGGGGAPTAGAEEEYAEPGAVDADAGGEGGEYAEAGPGNETDVSGENAGASVNGRCKGDPEQCRIAEELLEQIKR